MSDTSAPVLRARTAPAPTPALASEADAALEVMMRRARVVARAGDAVPRSYRGNEGAVLLAAEWAQSRGLDLLTAIQGVTFIAGRPVIDATLQRALAKRAGYRVVPTAATAESATVEVRDAGTGEVIGSSTFTMDDARRAGLANKDNWKNNPEDMLVARATTRAMRRFAPEVMVGLVIADELTDPVDDLNAHAEVVEVVPDPPAEDVVEAEVVEAEVVEVPDVVAEPEAAAPVAVSTIQEAFSRAKAAGWWPALVNALGERDLPVNPRNMTAVQRAQVHQLVAEQEVASDG